MRQTVYIYSFTSHCTHYHYIRLEKLYRDINKEHYHPIEKSKFDQKKSISSMPPPMEKLSISYYARIKLEQLLLDTFFFYRYKQVSYLGGLFQASHPVDCTFV